MVKTHYRVHEVLDERGRFVSPSEFQWFMNQFGDRYDPRRLAIGLMFTTGLRREDACRARLRWFNKEFTEMKMSQCKAKVKKEDDTIVYSVKPRFVPVSNWLSQDLRRYVMYRLMIGWYVGEGIEDFQLFPKLNPPQLNQFFSKLRERHADKAPWLLDTWKIIKTYDKEMNLIRQQKLYRVAPHAGRAHYTTAAYEVSNKDIAATKVLSGHSQTKDLERYVKVSGIMERKREIKERHMDSLVQEQKIPLLLGQKKLSEFSE